MIMPLKFDKTAESPLKVLCLGAHSDDIEIGCGGTLIKLIEKYPNCEILWVVFSGNSQRAKEAKKSAEIYLASLNKKEVVIENFRDTFFPYTAVSIKEYFETIKKRITPDIVFTHHRNDLHQDHRLLAELAWNAFRDHLILEYEIFKYDGDLGTPNMYFPIERSLCEEKVRRLFNCFLSQAMHPWFDEECFMGLMRLRGAESNSPTKYAEAFYCRKSSLTLF